ncbi:MAG: exo 1,3/1,4-beta-D-glucan glucohydrolase [Proteobacteria bacterium]|nr:exo 1,3/1,4-beta-D-glucan glucohydrolase [Pseudomonadota bacterium]
MKSLSLEEKVGQLIQADIGSIKPEDLAQYPLGSILAGGNAAPDGNVRSGAEAWLNLTEAFSQASRRRPSPAHPPIPILFGIDAVHGHAKIRGATLFPHNIGLGAAHDPGLIEKIGRATAEEVAATGIDWTFAPTVAVVRDVRWGRSYESYSEDPGLVAEYAQAMVNGLQGKAGTADFLTAAHTLGSAKHFLGDGGTLAGRDQFDNLSDEHTLRDIHGAGFVGALSAGDLIVMASYNGWHGTKMHANPQLLTDVLKRRWSFPGFVVGDWNAHEEIPGCTKWSCPAFLSAGGDMYMAPDSWKQLYANLLKQVGSGEISQARVDDAVTRILRVKMLAGLFNAQSPKQRVSVARLAAPGSAAHRALARQAVRESLVLLKNNRHVLPLDPHSNILVAGAGANDIGMQSGGWTVDWQGNHNTNADFPGGTSILAGIAAAVQAGGGKVVTRLEDRPAAAIVVYGEKPYAEFQGDRETLELPAGDGHLELLKRLRAAHIPVISLFISGRPLWTNREINLSDAFVAVWLPGSEGGGIADLLFTPGKGATAYDFTGRLSFSWPATAMPVTFSGNEVKGAQFARGFGLTLAQSPELGELPENPEVAAAFADRDSLFSAGHVTAPWSIYVSDPSAEVRLTMQSQVSPAGAVTARLADQSVQAVWSGQGPGIFRIGGRATNLVQAVADNQVLKLHYRVEQSPRQAVILSLRCEPAERCGLATGSGLDLTAAFRGTANGDWQTLSLPLGCLKKLGAALAAVTAPFAIETAGPFAVRFDDIRIARQPGATSCPPNT